MGFVAPRVVNNFSRSSSTERCFAASSFAAR
jgi:hypothetical protein